MSGATTELSLATAVDNDDNADYLTIALANSLRTIDGLFNNVTGHNHATAHQGGPISTSVLKGAYDIPDWYRSTGHTSAYPTTGAGLELFYDATSGAMVQGYNRATTAFTPISVLGSTITLTGAVTCSSTLAVTGATTLTGNVNFPTTGATLSFAGGGYIADTTAGRIRLSGLDVQPNGTTLAGTVTINGAANVNGTLTVGSGNIVSAGGEVQAVNGRFSGGVILGNAQYVSFNSASTSIYGDTSLIQFATPNLFRFNRAGTLVDCTIGTITSGSTAFGHNSALYVSTGFAMVVGGTDNHGQSFYVNGGAGGPTGWQTISNELAKSNVVTIDNALQLVMDPSLHGIHYTLTELPDPTDAYGFQAEPWAVAAPDVVSFDDQGVPHMMDYGQISAITWEALKEYIAQTDARLAALEAAR